MAEQLMPVYVHSEGQTHCIEISHLATVGDLAAAVPGAAALTLAYGGVVLEHGATLADVGIGAQARVEATARGAVVLDTDHWSLRYGLDTSARPQSMRAVVGYPRHAGMMVGMQQAVFRVGDDAIRRVGVLVLRTVCFEGLIGDGSNASKLWGEAVRQLAEVDPQVFELPVIVAEGSLSTAENREAIARAVFERRRAAPPGLFIVPSPVMALAATDRQAGIVLDSAFDCATAAAVQGGRIVGRVQYSLCGQKMVATALRALLLREHGCSFTPKTEMDILRNILKQHCFVAPEQGYSDERQVPYELPYGRELQLGTERYKAAEVLFSNDQGVTCVHQLVLDAASSCPADQRSELLSNVVICGKGAGLRGFGLRLQNELRIAAGDACTVVNIDRAAACPPEAAQERADTCACEELPWQGARMMARGSARAAGVSMVTLAEYEAKGPAAVHARCAPLPPPVK
eukprot:TRINITY_DN2488_c0_g1_i8.p1 TRINITY_DN2488_c0_g1~~TRINITY_DN2488_c0_g1_i8.p1  ORF type:complete len:490 (+),score=108.11 TRINITY_DN2488_c0_g1_i8:96-1472(+)